MRVSARPVSGSSRAFLSGAVRLCSCHLSQLGEKLLVAHVVVPHGRYSPITKTYFSFLGTRSMCLPPPAVHGQGCVPFPSPNHPAFRSIAEAKKQETHKTEEPRTLSCHIQGTSASHCVQVRDNIYGIRTLICLGSVGFHGLAYPYLTWSDWP